MFSRSLGLSRAIMCQPVSPQHEKNSLHILTDVQYLKELI
jgi:hypothetical protein